MNPTLAMHAAQTPLAVKGFRVTCLKNGERVECWKYRATELAARQAAADVKWLNMRNPALEYQLEAIEFESGGAAVTSPQTLILTADETPTAEEILANARVEAGEYDIVESRE